MNEYIVLSFPLFSNGKAIAAAICRRYGLEHFQIGNYFRELRRQHIPIGQEILQHMDAGHLIPDTLITQVIGHYLETEKIYKGVLFENYPHDAEKAQLLDTLLEARREKVSFAFGFDPGMEMAEGNIRAAMNANTNCGEGSYEEYIERYEISRKHYADVEAYYTSTGVFHQISGWPDIQRLL